MNNEANESIKPITKSEAKPDTPSVSERKSVRQSSGRTPDPRRKTGKRLTREQKKARIYKRVAGKAALLYFAFVLIIALILVIAPRSTTSDIEKRSLATMPAFSFSGYFAGDFTSGITNYYDDTVPIRDTMKNIGNNIKSLFGIKSKNTVEVIGAIAKVEETTTAAEEETTAIAEEETETTTEEETQDTVNSKDYRGAYADATMEDGILVVYQDNHWRALALYGGVYDTLYADTVNYINRMVSDDINIYFMPIPVASQFYLPSNYEDYSVDQKSTFDTIYSEMDSDIIYVDIIETLNNHNEEPIYLRTDHHWAPLGAYYAAREFAKAANLPFADLDTYDVDIYEDYLGSMYSLTESANILNDPEQFIWYKGQNECVVDYYDSDFNYQWTGSLYFDQPTSNAYCVYLGSDDEIAKITTDTKNGRVLLLVKDSFGDPLPAYLLGSFEEILVIDQRYFYLNIINFINTMGVTDILFAHNGYSLTSAEAELLESISYDYTDVPIYDTAPEATLTDSSEDSKEEEESTTTVDSSYEEAENSNTYSEDTDYNYEDTDSSEEFVDYYDENGYYHDAYGYYDETGYHYNEE